jgi:hypothetical protein
VDLCLERLRFSISVSWLVIGYYEHIQLRVIHIGYYTSCNIDGSGVVENPNEPLDSHKSWMSGFPLRNNYNFFPQF